MHKIIGFLTLPLILQACTHQALYSYAASHQCYESERHSLDATPGKCSHVDEIDGRTYNEYKRQKEDAEYGKE